MDWIHLVIIIRMSLFCSMKLVKDMHTSLSPRDRSGSDMSSPRIISPRIITEDTRMMEIKFSSRSWLGLGKEKSTRKLSDDLPFMF